MNPKLITVLEQIQICLNELVPEGDQSTQDEVDHLAYLIEELAKE